MRALIIALVLALLVAFFLVSAASARIPPLYKNCTAFNKWFPHGIGRAHARDKTSGTPVTTFRRNNRLYRLVMSYNRGLDGDKDGIACEKA